MIFLKIVKSYDFPKRTDFVFIGEINSLGDQYEIDFKLIDVTLQKGNWGQIIQPSL